MLPLTECSTVAPGPQPGDGLLMLPLRVLLLVPPLLVLAKLRRFDPDPALLGVPHLITYHYASL
jgi:hypothetical protein